MNLEMVIDGMEGTVPDLRAERRRIRTVPGEQMTIDKDRVKKAFSRQASVYEENAPLQKEVAEKLVSFIASRLPVPDSRFTALDVGIGTGFATDEFASEFSEARIFGCDIAWGMLKEAVKTGALLAESDAEHLPYKDDIFGLVFSSLALQWTNLNYSLAEAFRVLRADGLLCFSTFGERTLNELADSYDSASRSLGIEGRHGTMKFEPPEKIRALMESIGFREAEIKTELIICRYASPELLLRSLKAIGAGNPSGDFHPPRTLLQKTFQIYNERYRGTEGIPATFEIVYAWGRKS